jgi:hypothetical protein
MIKEENSNNSKNSQSDDAPQFFSKFISTELNNELTIQQLENLSKLLQRCISKPEKVDTLLKEMQFPSLAEYVKISPDNCKNVSKCFQKKISELKLEAEKKEKESSSKTYDITKISIDELSNNSPTEKFKYIFIENFSNSENDDMINSNNSTLIFILLIEGKNIEIILLNKNTILTFQQTLNILQFKATQSIFANIDMETYIYEEKVGKDEILQKLDKVKFLTDIHNNFSEYLNNYIKNNLLQDDNFKVTNIILEDEISLVNYLNKFVQNSKIKTNNIKSLKNILP